MESPERAHTHIHSPEEAAEIKAEELKESIDAMDIVGIDERIEADPDAKDEIIVQSMDRFLSLQQAMLDEGYMIQIAIYSKFLSERGFFKQCASEEGITHKKYHENLVSALKSGEIDKEEWLDSLRAYKQYLKEHQQKLEEQFESLATSFSDSFDSRINPLLSSPIPREDVLSSVLQNDIRVIDPLGSTLDGHHVASGFIGIGMTQLVHFDSYERSRAESIQHTFNHEGLHTISRGVFLNRIKKTEEEIQEDGTKVVLRHVMRTNDWSGLEMTQYEGEKFNWLNEAVTETLAAIVSDAEPNAYPEFIELFDLMCEKGKVKIEKTAFYDAYFEKKGYLRDKNAQRNFWNELMQKIEEAYPTGGKKFLVYLDDLVREEGIEKAIEVMENWDSKTA